MLIHRMRKRGLSGSIISGAGMNPVERPGEPDGANVDIPLHYHNQKRKALRRFMWKVRKLTEDTHLVFGISGRIEEGQLAQLEKALVLESQTDGVILDLKDVKLVDQACVTFLASCETRGWTLRNCPAYIREWIDREKA